MLNGQPRVQVPSSVAPGEIFTVKALIAHPMETGLRTDEHDKIIPRKIINKFVCRYSGDVVFSVDFFEAVAANPYLEFSLRATTSGELAFTWEEDGGATAQLTHNLIVSS